MKNALIAFDKFKDALSAHDACAAAAAALHETRPAWKIEVCPLADGGDGFCDTLTRLCEGRFYGTPVSGPLGQGTSAFYGMVETSRISRAALEQLALPPEAQSLAIVEFAQSSGIALVPQPLRSPWKCTSYGLGQTLERARQNGADAILIGLGGSATHDLALGALQALGFQFADEKQQPVEAIPFPENWQSIHSIKAPPEPFDLPVRIACDVENPLLGPDGAAAVFGPQKGLQASDYELLENETHRLATLLCNATGASIQTMNTAGCGAAGGAAFGLLAGLGGKLVPGAELVFAWSSLPSKLAAADLVITGEGKFDASSLQGKGPGSLAKKALEQNKQLLILAGCLGDLSDTAISNCAHAITPPGTPIETALSETANNLGLAIKKAFAG